MSKVWWLTEVLIRGFNKQPPLIDDISAPLNLSSTNLVTCGWRGAV
jgi:hypothetical protein